MECASDAYKKVLIQGIKAVQTLNESQFPGPISDYPLPAGKAAANAKATGVDLFVPRK